MKHLKLLKMALLIFSFLASNTGCKKQAAETMAEANPEAQYLINGSGLVQTLWPSAQDPGMPYYSRIEPTPPFIYHNGEYAAIVFYREPQLIPAGFNLLSMFDVPHAFSVPSSVSGKSLWNGQAGLGSPKMVTSQAINTVTIWFVPLTPLENIIHTQGALTMSALSAIPGILIGHASHFQEVNHPHPLPQQFGGGGHPAPKIVINAKGSLEGGGKFQLHLSGHQSENGWIRSAKILFN